MNCIPIKSFVLFLIPSFLLSFSSVQGEPGWVKKAVENEPAAEISPEATAVILYRTIVLTVLKPGQARKKVQQVLKILKPQGLDYADLEITTNSSEAAKNVQGWCLGSSGFTRKLDPKNIREVNLTQTAGYYDDVMVLHAGFHDVAPGDVVAYEYEIVIDDSLRDNYYTFNLQYGLPVLETSLEIEIPDGWQMQISEKNLPPIAFHRQEDKYIWEGHHLPYRAEEAYMPDWQAGARQVSINCYSPAETSEFIKPEWTACSKWAWKIFEKPAEPTPDLAELAVHLTDKAALTGEKCDITTGYVRDKIRYVAVEIGEGRFKPRPADMTYHNLYGDCKDKVTLARAMLATLGIASYPVLAQTHYTVDTGLPTPFQFNHCILAIPQSQFESPGAFEQRHVSSSGFIFIDPTYEYAPTGYLYPPVYGNRVLVASEKGGSLVQLPELLPQNNRRVLTARARLNGDRSFSAEILIRDYGHQAVNTRRHLSNKADGEASDEYCRWLAQTCKNPRLEAFTFQDYDDSILVSFNLSADSYLGESGAFLLLKADFFHPEWNSKLKKGERTWPVYFGLPSCTETEIEWRLDGTFTHEEKTDSGRFACPLGEITWEESAADSIIAFKTSRVFSGGTLPTEDYALAREFEKKLKACCDRKFILTSK
jgi:hypothetical protein